MLGIAPDMGCTGSLLRGAQCASLALLLGLAPAAAQTIERNPAPDPAPARGGLAIGETEYGRDDAVPLGVDLAGIRLIGPDDPVAGRPARGIDIGAVPDVPAGLAATLSRFLSRPLSLALVADIQAAVAASWRRAGYPFVSVTAPPQEITSGVLQLRVIEARMGEVEVEGGAAARGPRLAARIRARKGDRIRAAQLEEDLDWINRNPHRHVEAVFAAGIAPGESDLTLRVTEQNPFSVFAGWSNTGAAATGRDRWFAGFGAWVPALNDLTFSYQLTGSGGFWGAPGRIVLAPGAYPSYLAHSARFVQPTAPRQAIEFSPGLVASREMPDPLVALENLTLELPLIYRFAASELFDGRQAGDFYFGAEYKRLHRRTYFGGVEVGTGAAALAQFVAGWSRGFSHRHGRGSVDLRMKGNPGGIVFGNDAASWSSFTGGRVATASYVYGAADFAHRLDLPAGFGWGSQAAATFATVALLDTERMQLGGYHAARGYQIEDAAVDAGLVWRNELRLPDWVVPTSMGMTSRLSGFAFADAAYGIDIATGAPSTLASVGLGFDYDFGRHLSAGAVVAVPLLSAGGTAAGAVSVQARLLVRY